MIINQFDVYASDWKFSIKMKRIFILSIFSLIFPVLLFADGLPTRVSGVVYEKQSGEPLIGANIYWLGTTQGTVTNLDGHFELQSNPASHKLVASYVGYVADTLDVLRLDASNIIVNLSALQIDEVEVTARKSGASMNRLETLTTINITGDELCRAACCNLGESFETNASVDVNYTDATTGAKQIQLLGLSGRYVQMMTENIPNFRGISSPYGLSYVPGAWMESIQLSKGVGTVLNGYEAFTGQINVDYKKPTGDELLFVNLFGNSTGRAEANVNSSFHVSPRWSTAIFAHYSNDTQVTDENDDNYRDEPNAEQFNFINRWNYTSGSGFNLNTGVKVVHEMRTGGQDDFDSSQPSQNLYGVSVETNRVESWAKGGIVLNRPNTSIGLVASYIYHDQNSFFGVRGYDGTQHSLYANAVYQSQMGSERHQFHAGFSIQGDRYDEAVSFDLFDAQRLEKSSFDDYSGGLFYQYTYQIPDKLTIMAGVRGDWHNHYDFFVTPRLHVRYLPFEHTTIRLAAGRGYRTSAVYAENNYLMASSRSWQVENPFMQEKAWNYGVNVTQYVDLWGHELMLNGEFYRTDFSDQLVIDYDASARSLAFYNLHGKSYANNLQFETKYTPVKGLDVTAAIRWNDARQNINGELQKRPFVSEYKGLVALSYATPLKKWQFDASVQLNGGGRVPDTSENPLQYRRSSTFNSYQVYQAQVTKFFRKWQLYVGGENLGNFTQDNPIIAGDDPFGQYFDGSMVWGPLMGRRFYAGIRVFINRD